MRETRPLQPYSPFNRFLIHPKLAKQQLGWEHVRFLQQNLAIYHVLERVKEKLQNGWNGRTRIATDSQSVIENISLCLSLQAH